MTKKNISNFEGFSFLFSDEKKIYDVALKT